MKYKALVFAVIISLAAAGSALAHCGKCGVGEAAEEGKTEAHAMEAKTCACGMKLSEEAAVHVEIDGKTKHFCSLACANAYKKKAAEAATE